MSLSGPGRNFVFTILCGPSQPDKLTSGNFPCGVGGNGGSEVKVPKSLSLVSGAVRMRTQDPALCPARPGCCAEFPLVTTHGCVSNAHEQNRFRDSHVT